MNAATIISVYPLEITERRTGMIPSYFHLDPAKIGDFSILVVGECISHVYIDSDRGSFVKKLDTYEVAKSIVTDFCLTHLHASHDACAGLAAVEGEFTKEEVAKRFGKLIIELRQRQAKWFHNLIKDADDLWAKHRKHNVISNLAREACKIMNVKREWADLTSDEAIKCPACKEAVDPEAIVCKTCRTVLKPEEFKKLQVA